MSADNAKLWIGLIGILAVLGLIILPAIGIIDAAIIGALGALAFGAQSALGGMAIPNVSGLLPKKQEKDEQPPGPPGR